MFSQESHLQPSSWICPNLTPYWQLNKTSEGQIRLTAKNGQIQHQFSPVEGYALQHFIGRFTVEQIQQKCEAKFPETPPNFTIQLLEKLLNLGLLETSIPTTDPNWICPDLTAYWQLGKIPNSDQIILKAKEGNLRAIFTAEEGYALRYFTGKFTVSQIQQKCEEYFPEPISPNLVTELLEKLVEMNILEIATEIANELGKEAEEIEPEKPTNPQGSGPKLKACVRWIEHPEGYWILRNPEDVKFLQVSRQDKDIIDQIGQRPLGAIAAEFCVAPEHLKRLLQLLTATAMLEGTKPPKPPKKKFSPFSLLFFRIPLFNPDKWLSKHIDSIRWLWSKPVAFLLIIFLAASTAIGISQRAEILHQGQQLMAAYGSSLILIFGLLTALVVTLHELGHAFTLKRYGGIVPEIGLLMIMLMPAAYTNTTDAYCLVRRYQRVLVVAAGVLVQFIIAAISLCLWNWTAPGSWLHTSSYLLMAAALFTVALNLNPLARFDGYYLAVALTGINNLRSRAFGFYGKLLTGKPIKEKGSDRLVLAIYAPFSLAYIWFVFGFLIWRVIDWSWTNIPTLAITLLILWLIYFYFPKFDN
jgi:putative peptide zinc metalloprotease protein